MNSQSKALSDIVNKIYAFWGCDPGYYADRDSDDAEAAMLCREIVEIAQKVTTPTIYEIAYDQFSLIGKEKNDFYGHYIKVVETEDVYHYVGEMIYKAQTAMKNIYWWKIDDNSVEEAMDRLSTYPRMKKIDKNTLIKIGDAKT